MPIEKMSMKRSNEMIASINKTELSSLKESPTILASSVCNKRLCEFHPKNVDAQFHLHQRSKYQITS